MVYEPPRINMRIRSLLLAAIITLSSMSGVIASDTVTTQDVDISGNYTMTGNYTVSHGTTLTIKPGTTIDMQEYWMKVEGTLIVDNSTIMSSVQTTSPGGHNAGVWDSITIASGGSAILDNVTISNAKSCLIVDGSMVAKSLAIEDCLIGIEVAGTADVDGLSIESVDNDGVRVSGNAQLSNVDILLTTTGISSTGDLVVSDGDFQQIGTGISLAGGTADVDDINFISGIGNAVSITSGVSGDIDGMTGSSSNAIVAIDSTGFQISNVDMSGDRLVNSWSAGDLTITGATYFADSSETPIDMRTSGTVTLSDISLTGQFSSLQGSYNAPWIGIALAGSGDYLISNSHIEATDYAVKASGTGTLSVSDSLFLSENNGFSFSGISQTTLDNVTLNITQGGEKGIDILQGAHSFSELEVNMPFNQYATGSTGIEAWWCSINAQDITVTGFANSMSVYESDLITEDLHLLDSSKQGLYASSSMIHVSDSMQTRTSDTGLMMISSQAVLRTWSASTHEDAANIDLESEVTIWDFTSIGQLNSDSTGDGTLNYGSSQTLSKLQTASNNRLWEMTINFEDLTGNPVDADWHVLGFSDTASSGTAVLPVSELGSQITATYGGVGALSTPTGVQGGTHTIQVPIMPQADWTLSSGSVVVLGPTDDGMPHSAGGNITIPANAKLILMDTSLMIPEGANLIVNSYGDFEGENSQFHGDIISHSDLFSDSPTSNLTIEGDVFWTSCQNDMVLYNLHIEGSIQLDNSCKVTINSGSTPSSWTIGVGAVFEIVNRLDVTVLDKGEPVQGATITVDGQSVSTDSAGMASKSVTALSIDSSGVVSTGLMQVQMNWGQISDLMAWDTSTSKQHTFVASTVQSGSLTEWLELEKAWSPYHLTDDLVIPQFQTMTINDEVYLRVASEATITVEGTFNSGYSTISSLGGGASWGGLVIGGSADTEARIIGTSLVEGSPLVTIDGESDVAISHAYLARSSGAEPLVRMTNAASGSLQLVSTTLTDSSSHCIEAQGSAQLILSQVVMQSCAHNSLWARGLPLSINGLDVSQRIDLEGVTGEVSDLTGHQLYFNNLDGFTMDDISLTFLNGYDNRDITIDGATIAVNTLNDVMGMPEQFKGHEIAIKGDVLYDSINNINSTFILHEGFTELKIDFNFASTSDGIEDNRTLYVEGVLFMVDGQWILEADVIKPKSPPVDFDNTAGSISNLIVNCGGQGTGLISHHGRASPLTIEDSSISSCTKGIDLHTDGSSAPMILENVAIDSMVAISSDGSDISVTGGFLNGSLDVDNAVANLYNVAPLSQSTLSGEIWVWVSHILDVRLGGAPQDANLVLEVGQAWSGSAQGSSILVYLPAKLVDGSGTQDFTTVRVIATAENLPETEKFLTFGLEEPEIIQIDMIGNQAPEAEIIIPDEGFRIMETLPLEVRALVSDDLDDNQDLDIVWKVTVGQDEVMRLNGEWNNLTDLSAGEYILTIEVTDLQGKMTTESISFEVTLLDSDGDVSPTCNEDYFDKEENVYCGPDIYDKDDDNDGVLDTSDAYPTDPCANTDTDRDGQPDTIKCPLGVTTWLTEDQDDDGDGVPDVSEGTESEEDSESSPITVIVFVLIFLAAAAFMLLRRKEEVY